ncbi:MAG TPA: HEAT repeat domain-containing protein [Dactylosporangium sp.]|nr:HEAT repeat domain-containing protein [Dactylosporangium sp.]
MIDTAAALDAVFRHATDLEDDYDDIAHTLTALAESGDAALVPRLETAMSYFLDEQNFYGRDLIAAVLAGIQGTAALPTLLHAAARDLNDDQDSLSVEIIELLEADPEAARPIAQSFATADAPALRRVGVWALGFVPGTDEVALLTTAAADPDAEIRSMAIAQLPDPAGDDDTFATIVAALRDFQEQVRVSAVSRLGFTARPDAVAPVVSVTTDLSPHVRSMAAYALGRLRSPEATPALLRLLDDPDSSVRAHARHALGEIGDPPAVDALLSLAASPDPELRIDAAKALAQAAEADPRVPPKLTQLATDPEPEVRAATLSGVASTSGDRSRWSPLLLALTDDPDASVRQRVAVLARHLSPAAARDLLHRYATDPDARVRDLAATELTRLA